MGTSAPKKQGNQWSLLDLVSGVMLVSVFVFLVLVYTHLGDSLAISGRQALALNRRDSKSRERILNSVEMGQILEVCPQEFVDYMPCEDPKRARLLSRERNFYRERHCPTLAEKLLCLIPPPRDYKSPVAWPESLHKVWVLFAIFCGIKCHNCLNHQSSISYEVLCFLNQWSYPVRKWMPMAHSWQLRNINQSITLVGCLWSN